MNKKRNRYDGEFKLNSVKLVLNSKGERTMKAIAEDLGINYWVLVQCNKEYLQKKIQATFARFFSPDAANLPCGLLHRLH